MDLQLSGKQAALVTGSSGGIGEAIATSPAVAARVSVTPATRQSVLLEKSANGLPTGT